MSTITVAAALAQARTLGVDALDAQLMLGRLLHLSRTGLITRDDAVVDDAALRQWERWLTRRLSGEPLAYLLGEKEFHGLLLEVNRAVLVPRPETELLVDWIGELASRMSGAVDVLDLGTGSGAIALAAKHARPTLIVTATDRSSAALSVARENARRLRLDIELIEASWWHGLEGRAFDIVAANPPYVRADDVALHALGHEPREALTPGADGLGALREIVLGAPTHIRPEGWLLLEHGFDQGEDVRGLLAAAGFEALETRRDLAGHERSTGGRRPPASAR